PMHRLRATALTIVAVAAVAVSTGSSTATTSSHGRDCAKGFTSAVEQYRRTTFDKDADGFNALLAPEITIIFADGSTLLGKEESAAWIERFFADPQWTQTLDVVRTTHESCRTGFVLFDSVYTPTPADPPKPLAIGVTFVRSHGEWLVLHNQDSTGPITHLPSP
ncbi:MAG: YybH family protein, partial [Nocardioidaceae bacterium]